MSVSAPVEQRPADRPHLVQRPLPVGWLDIAVGQLLTAELEHAVEDERVALVRQLPRHDLDVRRRPQLAVAHLVAERDPDGRPGQRVVDGGQPRHERGLRAAVVADLGPGEVGVVEQEPLPGPDPRRGRPPSWWFRRRAGARRRGAARGPARAGAWRRSGRRRPVRAEPGVADRARRPRALDDAQRVDAGGAQPGVRPARDVRSGARPGSRARRSGWRCRTGGAARRSLMPARNTSSPSQATSWRRAEAPLA